MDKNRLIPCIVLLLGVAPVVVNVVCLCSTTHSYYWRCCSHKTASSTLMFLPVLSSTSTIPFSVRYVLAPDSFLRKNTSGEKFAVLGAKHS